MPAVNPLGASRANRYLTAPNGRASAGRPHVVQIVMPDASEAVRPWRRRDRREKSGLRETIRYFSDPAVCLEAAAKARWPNGVACPRCDCQRLSFLKTRLMWTCLECRKQFSVKVGTIFEDSAISLNKWLTAMWMVANCKGFSSYEAARDLEVTQRTAWFMLHRIHYALQEGSLTQPAPGRGRTWGRNGQTG
jgi:transposase-like protein